MHCEESVKTIVFSKYLAYQTGGAEKSMIELLKKENKNNIELLSFNNVKTISAQDKKIKYIEINKNENKIENKTSD